MWLHFPSISRLCRLNPFNSISQMESERRTKMVTRIRNPPWSDLPQELLSAIANFLISNPLWILTFRSVCNSWRSSFPRHSHSSILSPHLPLSIPRPTFSFYIRGGSFLSLTVIYALHRPLELSDGVFSSSTPNSWILFVDETIAGKVSVRKPFSSFSTPCNFPKSINLIDFNVVEISRFYNLIFSDNYNPRIPFNRPRFGSENVDKVVLFPNGLAAIALSDVGKLWMIRFNVGIHDVGEGGISKWEILHDGKGFRFDDIVEFKGRVLGIDRRGRVYAIAYHSLQVNLVVPPIAGGGGRRKRLVESLGSLYMVVRCYVDSPKTDRSTTRVKLHELSGERRKTKFKVYELNEVRNKWVELTSIGDRSFFFSRDFSFSVSAVELGTCENNCILFEKRSFRSYSRDIDDYIVFSKTKNSDLDIGVCHLNDVVHSAAIESHPGYLDILWPPPSWVWSVDRLKRREMVETAMDEILNRMPEKFKSKFQELAVEGASLSCDDFQQHGGLEIWRAIQVLKNMLNVYEENEQTFTSFHEDYSTSVHKLNQLQIKGSLVQARIAGLVTEERHNYFDEFQSSIKRYSISTDNYLNKLRPWFVKQNAMIFRLEELASSLVSHYYLGHGISNT